VAQPPKGIPRRRLHEVLEEETGMQGLGADVMQSLMDEVNIEEKPAVKTVTMVKNLR
jgi:anti-sigma regulatory factor (Ser/Thr protein kinase)